MAAVAREAPRVESRHLARSSQAAHWRRVDGRMRTSYAKRSASGGSTASSNAWTTTASRSKSRRGSRRASGRTATESAGTNSRQPACSPRPALLRLRRKAATPQNRRSPRCRPTLPKQSGRTSGPGNTFRRLPRRTGAISSCGFTRPSDQRLGNGVFARRLACSRPAGSSA